MPRFDVTVYYEARHHFAIEAETADEARAQAITEVTERDAERSELRIEVERGPL